MAGLAFFDGDEVDRVGVSDLGAVRVVTGDGGFHEHGPGLQDDFGVGAAVDGVAGVEVAGWAGDRSRVESITSTLDNGVLPVLVTT